MIWIQDPNQGCKGIKEEIISRAWTSSTPIPPQTGGHLEPQANGETPQLAVIICPDDLPQGMTVVGKGVTQSTGPLNLHLLPQLCYHHLQFYSQSLSQTQGL